MNKLSTLIIALLSVIVSQPSNASHEEFEKAFSGQVVRLDEITPKDSYQWLERKGFELNPLQRRALGKAFSQYTKSTLTTYLELMDNTGVLAKCENAYGVAKVLRAINPTEHKTGDAFLKWMEKSGAIGCCITAAEIVTLWAEYARNDDNLPYMGISLVTVMADMALLRHCGGLEHVLEFFRFSGEASVRGTFKLWDWLSQTRVMRVCGNLMQDQRMLLYLDQFAVNDGEDVMYRLSNSDVLGLCETVVHVQQFLEGMKQLTADEPDKVFCRLGKASNQEFKNIEQVFEYMKMVKTSKLKFKKTLRDWMGRLHKMDELPRVNLPNSLRAIKAMDPALRKDLLDLLMTQKRDVLVFEAIDHKDELLAYLRSDEELKRIVLEYIQVNPEDGLPDSQLGPLIKTLQAFSAEERRVILSLHFSYDNDAEKIKSNAAQRLDVLRYLEKFDPALRTQVMAWLVRTLPYGGLTYGRQTSRAFKELFNFLGVELAQPQSVKGKEDAAEVARSTLGSWFRATNWFDKSQQFRDLETVLSPLQKQTQTQEEFNQARQSLLAKGLIDADYLYFMWQARLARMDPFLRLRLLEVLKKIKDLDAELRHDLLSFFRAEGVASLLDGSDLSEGCKAFLRENDGLQARILEGVGEVSGALSGHDKLNAVIKTFQAYTAEERRIVLSLPFSFDHSSAQSRSVEAQRLEVLRMFQSYDPKLRTQIVFWLGRVMSSQGNHYGSQKLKLIKDAFDRLCAGSVQIQSVKGKGKFASVPMSALTEWMRASNWFARSTKFTDLENVMSLYAGTSKGAEEFNNACRELMKNSLIDGDFLQLLMKMLQPSDVLYDFLGPLLDDKLPLRKDDPKKEGIVHNHIKSFYLFLLASGFENPRIRAYFEELLADDSERGNFLAFVVQTLGEEHAVTQYYLNLGRGYVDLAKDTGFVATHIKMMKTSAEEAVHKPQSNIPGCALNLDMVTEPRPPVAIHMPVTEWYSLFDRMAKLPADAYALELQEKSLSSFRILRNLECLISLLDPEGSVKAKEGITSHSQMLRSVLAAVQEDLKKDPTYFGTFVQLCANITSCTTSKLDGITQSYVYRDGTILLKDCDLASLAFQQDLLGYIKDELRRFRVVVLNNVVAKKYGDSPHNTHFGRGILGHDIGIMFKGEIPKIDLDGSAVYQNLLKASKQDLLDPFYEKYTAQAVVSRIHDMLNTGIDGAKNLVVDVICKMFGAKALSEDGFTYDEQYVEVHSSGKPIGFTTLAVKELLLTLGILRAVP
jgi:hypothetical protein